MDTQIGESSFYKRFINGRRELILTALLFIAALVAATIEYGLKNSMEIILIVIGVCLFIRLLLGVLLIGECVLKRIKLPLKELLIVAGSGLVLLMLKLIWDFDLFRIWKFSVFVALVIFALVKILARKKRDYE
jgi:hypothetical protein